VTQLQLINIIIIIIIIIKHDGDVVITVSFFCVEYYGP